MSRNKETDFGEVEGVLFHEDDGEVGILSGVRKSCDLFESTFGLNLHYNDYLSKNGVLGKDGDSDKNSNKTEF